MEWEDLSVFFEDVPRSISVIGGSGAFLLQLAALRPVQLRLHHTFDGLAQSELCWQAGRVLDETGMRTLFGHNLGGRRVFLYHQLRDLLTSESRQHWDQNEARIREGIFAHEAGNLIRFRKWLLPIVHRRSSKQYRNINIDEQQQLFSSSWGHRRARILTGTFSLQERAWVRTIPKRFSLGLFDQQPVLRWLFGEENVSLYDTRALKRLKRKPTMLEFFDATKPIVASEQCWVLSTEGLWSKEELWFRVSNEMSAESKVYVVGGTAHQQAASKVQWAGRPMVSNGPSDVLDLWRYEANKNA